MPKLNENSRFGYRRRSEEAVKHHAERRVGAYDSPFKGGFDTFRPPEGNSTVRIIQPTWEENGGTPEHFGYRVIMHSYVGPNGDSYLCRNKMLKKPCALCDAAGEARKAGEDDEAKKLSPSEKFVYWIIDRDDKSETPKLWLVSASQDKDIAMLCNTKRGVIFPDDPEEGRDIDIRRKGTDLRTKYVFAFDTEATPLSDSAKGIQKIIDFVSDNPIPSVLNYYDNNYLSQIVSGESEEKDEDEPKTRRKPADEDEEDDAPPPRRARKASDEDDEEDQPKRRTKSTAKYEDDDAPWDKGKDDEDDAPPPRRARKASDEDDEENDYELKSRRKPSEDDDEGEVRRPLKRTPRR